MHRFEDLRFDNIYSSLPSIFYSRHQPMPLAQQHLVHFNSQVAEMLGLDPAEAGRGDLVELITRQTPLDGFDSLAMCYAGHQFGQYVPRLGDGRAVLLGQLITGQGSRWDLQLKGAGLTLYSRQGDGKAVLRSTIREHLCSAAMHGLGIPTTHSLAMFGSKEEVYREQIEPGAMLIRVAPSHIRFGSFEYFFYSNRIDELRTLGEFTIEHYFPHLRDADNRFLALLDDAVASTAELIARWQSVGFCHGVMNSDNMSIHGITIDYGPFGFLDRYDAGHICNHSDYQGRYAFDQQSRIGLFNLSCLAQAILPLIDDDPDRAVELATDSLGKYEPAFDAAFSKLKGRKLGIADMQAEDGVLYDQLLELMQGSNVDFTLFFRQLSEQGIVGRRDDFVDREKFDHWAERYRQRLVQGGPDEADRSKQMCEVNPKYVLRNYMAEQAIRLAQDQQEYAEIERLIQLLRDPYSEQKGMERYAERPPDWSSALAISCSS